MQASPVVTEGVAKFKARKTLYLANENHYHLDQANDFSPGMKLLGTIFRTPLAVKLAIAPEVLASLVEKGQIHASDFRCLDLDSKQFVWKMFLSLAKSKIHNQINQLVKQ
jgi:hypothetical protein